MAAMDSNAAPAAGTESPGGVSMLLAAAVAAAVAVFAALLAAAVVVAAAAARPAASSGGAIAAVVAIAAAGPRHACCKLAVPGQRPSNGHVFVRVVRAEAGRCAPDKTCAWVFVAPMGRKEAAASSIGTWWDT